MIEEVMTPWALREASIHRRNKSAVHVTRGGRGRVGRLEPPSGSPRKRGEGKRRLRKLRRRGRDGRGRFGSRYGRR